MPKDLDLTTNKRVNLEKRIEECYNNKLDGYGWR